MEGTKTKYWLFLHGQVLGPYGESELSVVDGFGADALVCDDEDLASGSPQWTRAAAVPALAMPVLEAVGGQGARTRWRGALPADPTLQDVACIHSLEEQMAVLANALVGLRKYCSRQATDLIGLQAELAEKRGEIAELKKRMAVAGERLLALDELKLADEKLGEGLEAETRRVDGALALQEARLAALKSESAKAREEILSEIGKVGEAIRAQVGELKERMNAAPSAAGTGPAAAPAAAEDEFGLPTLSLLDDVGSPAPEKGGEGESLDA
ncbi:MAG: hypothetical protein WC969_12255 [Elusimicrobiota bacterium]|jgi:hypothetical protein